MPVQLEICPSCQGALEVRELYCADCDITIRGRFDAGAPGPFAGLNDEQLAFMRLFVVNRGNMSDVERSLGVSYPTVRAKLDDLIAALTEPEAAPAAKPSRPLTRDEVLARISDGRMSVDEGMRALRDLPGEDE